MIGTVYNPMPGDSCLVLAAGGLLVCNPAAMPVIIHPDGTREQLEMVPGPCYVDVEQFIGGWRK